MKVLKPLKTKPQPRPPLPTFDNLIRGHTKNQLYLQITAFKQGITTSLVPSSTTGRQGLAICYIHLLTNLNSSFEFRHEDKLCQSPKLQRVNYHLTVWPFLLNDGGVLSGTTDTESLSAFVNCIPIVKASQLPVNWINRLEPKCLATLKWQGYYCASRAYWKYWH